jgi:hypothetical protein
VIKAGAKKYGGRVIKPDYFQKDDAVSYSIDFQNNSSTAPGGSSKGTIYIRGVQSKDKNSFKIVLEKSVDFNDLDS